MTEPDYEESITISTYDYQKLIRENENLWESLVVERATNLQNKQTIQDQAEGILKLQARLAEIHAETERLAKALGDAQFSGDYQ